MVVINVRRLFIGLRVRMGCSTETKTICAGAATICPAPCDLDLWGFDLLTLKVVSESRVTWPTSVPF